MADQSRHAEWLSLIERSGTFLTIPVLAETFPQGLGAIDEQIYKRTRDAYNEWREAVDEQDEDLVELHDAWIDFILKEVIEFDDSDLNEIKEGDLNSCQLHHSNGEGIFCPSFLLKSNSETSFLLIKVLQPDVMLDSIPKGDSWPLSFIERMIALCRYSKISFGLLTNGEEWALIYAPKDAPSSYGIWHARIWFQEKITFRAFSSLLSLRRWYGPANESLSTMFEKSLEHNEELTNTLGEQVRQAVEVLIQSLDKADLDRNRKLLKDVSPQELYEAGLTVMMRLVFVLSAEERGLLLLGEATYDQFYAVSTLRNQLSDESEKHGAEILENRHDAWSRLLSVFRAIYGGIDNDSLRMPALGGSLFDPDRFPFLEGRVKGSGWSDAQNHFIPLPINNRTVLLLLNALQVLNHKGGALLLSYKALDVEQIGHVYEGLLEYTVERFSEITLGLKGSQKSFNPNLSLNKLDDAHSENRLIELLKDITCRSESGLRNDLQKEPDELMLARLNYVCGGHQKLVEKLKRYVNLLREDAWGDLLIYEADSFAVTRSEDRRDTGTHYTPKSLTECIIRTTLNPIVYVGPAEGIPEKEWELRSSEELLNLKICDPAMGSGAFLVQSCRFLSEKVVEAWSSEIQRGLTITVDGTLAHASGQDEMLPESTEERLLIARRLVAERCIYGIDINPLAVELAKLSIWLVTLAKGRPFGFLDHNLRSGDSLLGLSKLDRLTKFSLHPDRVKTISLFASSIEGVVRDVVSIRKQLRETRIRDIRDVQHMQLLDHDARQRLERLEHIADAIIGEALVSGGNERIFDGAMANLATLAASYLNGDIDNGTHIQENSRKCLTTESPKSPLRPFHWALEFPEVAEQGGFDAIVSNPPFMGNKKISGILGISYRAYLTEYIAKGLQGLADFCAYFLLRYFDLIAPKGCVGIIATDKISQGDTRKVGIAQIYGDCSIFYAEKSIRWPGRANVYISILSLIKSVHWNGGTLYSPMLLPKETDLDTPFELKGSEGRAYIGSVLLGKGFIISDQVYQELITKDPRNIDVIRPYLGGEDINQHPESRPSRKVICFWDWPLSRETAAHDYIGPVAEDYPDCLDYLREFVKPVRDKKKRLAYKERWWRFAELSKGAYEIAFENKVLIRARVSPTNAFTFIDRGPIVSEQTVVFKGGFFEFGVLQSVLHEKWSIKYSTSKGAETLVYSPSSCLVTFPFPESNIDVEKLGREYFDFRKSIMAKINAGLTDLYNLINDRSIQTSEIQQMRSFVRQLDLAVLQSYGWADLKLDYDFYSTPQGVKYTISNEVSILLLQRLMRLNHDCHEIELKTGLHATLKSRKIEEALSDGNQHSLFVDD
jgi:hypothetical protein